ncbi:MAG: EAL domain-containing protein [Gammaproteobacteria bacterium]|nr:EAL domain-containing protein [Gammaproteobacteria bacterium]MDH5800037.1 EAL domain-containing protein [Gammaproteobacteria bacterium]
MVVNILKNNKFKLQRYYAIASLLGICVMVVGLSIFFRQLALDTLVSHQSNANVDLTRSFANSAWYRFSGFIETPSSSDSLTQLHQMLVKLMKGTRVVKIKIYNLDGMTVYSTDPAQIGSDDSRSAGFRQARVGEVASEITFRNEFSDFEQVVEDRNLITSYIPLKQGDKIKAVFEVYSDVTNLVEELELTQRKIIAGLFIAFAGLYLFLNMIIKRADVLLQRQEDERLQQEHTIWYQTYHDALTGLPNRESFMQRVSETMLRTQRNGGMSALLLVDLNRFKLINDSLGHSAGDKLLQITASRIQGKLRETDIAFRMAGDEFLVMLENLDRPEEAASAAQRIIDSITLPILLSNYEIVVKASIGISVFHDASTDVETLVKEADVAMHNAKEMGNNHYMYYSNEMNTKAFERLSLETDLHLAVQNQDFLLYYQPKVDAVSNELIGVEALLRWMHPVRGVVLPSLFVPYLEDMGLINEVGRWVLQTACRQAKVWRDNGAENVRMSVNISAKQFRSGNLVSTVQQVLNDAGLDGKYLELELTESMLVDNTEQAIRIMHELKGLGVALSIDDFGSGYSSLSYLKQFPVDYLKIDRSFIKDVVMDVKDGAIIKAIFALAHSLNLGIIAEGVEDQSQLDFIRSIGCHEVQGFFFSKPISAPEFESLFLNKNVRAFPGVVS